MRHHYDLPPEFFALFLGPSLTYSCALFSRGATTLEEAQEQKLELVCTKLRLQAGERVLDIGCGYGSFALHAAARHGVHVTGITLSQPQADVARRRVAEQGLEHLVDIRVADYRELDAGPSTRSPASGWSSTSVRTRSTCMRRRWRACCGPAAGCSTTASRVCATAIPRPARSRSVTCSRMRRRLHLSRIQLALERAGLVTDHVEGLHGDYAVTLTHWLRGLEDNIAEATRLAGPERIRVWRLYLRTARKGFLSGFMSVYQVLGHRLPVVGSGARWPATRSSAWTRCPTSSAASTPE